MAVERTPVRPTRVVLQIRRRFAAEFDRREIVAGRLAADVIVGS
jgi:hypothetical protein